MIEEFFPSAIGDDASTLGFATTLDFLQDFPSESALSLFSFILRLLFPNDESLDVRRNWSWVSG